MYKYWAYLESLLNVASIISDAKLIARELESVTTRLSVQGAFPVDFNVRNRFAAVAVSTVVKTSTWFHFDVGFHAASHGLAVAVPANLHNIKCDQHN